MPARVGSGGRSRARSVDLSTNVHGPQKLPAVVHGLRNLFSEIFLTNERNQQRVSFEKLYIAK